MIYQIEKHIIKILWNIYPGQSWKKNYIAQINTNGNSRLGLSDLRKKYLGYKMWLPDDHSLSYENHASRTTTCISEYLNRVKYHVS